MVLRLHVIIIIDIIIITFIVSAPLVWNSFPRNIPRFKKVEDSFLSVTLTPPSLAICVCVCVCGRGVCVDVCVNFTWHFDHAGKVP